MNEKTITNMTNEELIQTVERANSLGNQTVQAELTRRLIISMEKLNKSTNQYSRIIIILTFILMFVGITQVWIAVISSSLDEWVQYLYLGSLIIVTVLILKKYKY